MKKRLLSILLCLVMMVGLLSGAASAEGTTPITSLKFTLSGYTLGAKALELKLTKDPGDVGIDIEAVKVLKRGNSLEIVDPNEIFVPEMTYSVVIELKARDGFDITTLTKENVKATGDKLPFLGEAVEKLLFALGQPLQLEGVDTGGVAHFPQQAAFLVHHVVQQVLVGLRRHTENVIPAVAVAADRVYVSGFAQLHDVSERTEAVRPFFEEVAVDDENIVRVEADFFQ